MEQQIGSYFAVDQYPEFWITWDKSHKVVITYEKPKTTPRWQRNIMLIDLQENADPTVKDPHTLPAYQSRKIPGASYLQNATKTDRELKAIINTKFTGEGTKILVDGKKINVQLEKILEFLQRLQRSFEQSGAGVIHVANVLHEQLHLIFDGSALNSAQDLRHTEQKEFMGKAEEGTFPEPNGTIHEFRIALAQMIRCLCERLDNTIDESTMNAYARKVEIEQNKNGQYQFRKFGELVILLHRRGKAISNPGELFAIVKRAIIRLDVASSKFVTKGYYYKLFGGPFGKFCDIQIYQTDIPLV